LNCHSAKTSLSLRPAYCRFCKSNSLIEVFHYDDDNFSILTCTACLHSRFANDPIPLIPTPYGVPKSSLKKDLTGDGCVESNPGPPKDEQKSVQSLLGRLQYLENEIKSAKAGKQKKKKNKNKNNNNNSLNTTGSLGTVVSTRLIRTGMADIKGHRQSWLAGYIFVGNGTNGAANSVIFQTASKTYLVSGKAVANAVSTGLVPIAPSDADVGQSYLSDISKHFARKIIKKLFIHVMSLQPSTSNNMMCVIAPFKGGSAAYNTYPIPLATAAETGNTVNNVSSMRGVVTVDSWETKSIDITGYIGGGSGARQNEFDISALNSALFANSPSGIEGLGSIPAMFAIAGNSTTTALQNTQTHQIIIEEVVDYVDYVGGMSSYHPLE